MYSRIQFLKSILSTVFALSALTLASCSEKAESIVKNEPRKSGSAFEVDFNRTSSESQLVKSDDQKIDSTKDLAGENSNYWLETARANDLELRNSSDAAKNLDDILIKIRTQVQVQKSALPAQKFLDLLKYECNGVESSCSGLAYLKQSAQSLTTLMASLDYLKNPVDWVKYLFALNGLTTEKYIYLKILEHPEWEWNKFLRENNEHVNMLKIALDSVSSDFKTQEHQGQSQVSQAQGQSQLSQGQAQSQISQSTMGKGQVNQSHLLKWVQNLRGQWPDLSSKVILIGIQTYSKSFIDVLIDENKKQGQGLRPLMAMIAEQDVLQKSKANLASLKIKPLNANDALDILFLGLVSGQWSGDVASAWVRAYGTTESEIESKLRNFYKIRMLTQSYASHGLAKKWLNEGIETEKLFSYFLSKASIIRSQVASLKTQFLSLSNWSVRFAAEEKWNIVPFQGHLNSFDQTVKMLLSYPHMMVLFDRLASKRFVLKVFEREISSSDLMTYLMTGQLGLLTQYTESRSSFGMSDILQSFQLAVDARTFEQFGMSGDEFAAKISGFMSVRGQEFINKVKSQTESRLLVSQTFKQVSDVCSGQMRIPFRFYFSEIKASPLFGNTMNQLFTSISDRSANAEGARSSGLFYADKEFGEMLEFARTDLQHALRTARALQGIMISVQSPSSRISATVQQLEKLQKQTFAFAQMLNENVGKCLWNFSLTEKQLALELVKNEINHLKTVHRFMTSLRRRASVDFKNSELDLSSLKIDYKTQDKVTAESYIMNSADAYLRFARRLNNRNTPNTSPTSPKFKIEFGSKIDIDHPVFTEATETTVPFVSSETDFVASGLRALFAGSSSGEPVFNWFKNGDERFQQWINDLKSKMSLYRFARLLGSTSIKGEGIIDQHITILKHLQMSPFERQFLMMLKLDPLYDPVFLQDRILRYNNSEGKILSYLGLFDLMAQISKASDLGYGWDTSIQEIKDGYRNANRPNALDLALLYFQGRANGYRNKSLFEYNQNLNSYLDQQLKTLVRSEVGATQQIHQAIKSFIARDQALVPEKRFKVDINLQTQISGSYLSLGSLESYDATVKRFNFQTSSCFIQDTCAEMSLSEK